jgi:hypothetical protein
VAEVEGFFVGSAKIDCGSGVVNPILIMEPRNLLADLYRLFPGKTLAPAACALQSRNSLITLSLRGRVRSHARTVPGLFRLYCRQMFADHGGDSETAILCQALRKILTSDALKLVVT